jgi:hypothetical protein
MTPKHKNPVLGLRENWQQFTLLSSLVVAFRMYETHPSKRGT